MSTPAEAQAGTDLERANTPNSLAQTRQKGSHIKGNATSGDGQNYALALTPALTAYSDGQIFSVRFNDAQTVANPTLNINGLGAKAIKSLAQYPLDETNLLLTNRHYLVAFSSNYDDFHILSPTTANAAQMRAATSREIFATPGAMSNSPNCAKAWVNFNGTGTLSIRDSYGVSSVTDLLEGRYRVHFNFTWANNDYVAASTGKVNHSSGLKEVVGSASFSTTTYDIHSVNMNGEIEDCEYVTIAYFGENT